MVVLVINVVGGVMNTLNFRFDMEPRAAHRFRVSFKQRHVYEPDDDTVYKETMGKLAVSQLPEYFKIIEGMFSIEIVVYVKIPAKFNKAKRQEAIDGILRPTTKPDTDNYAKLVLDAFNGILYNDDKQNVDLIVRKYYSLTPGMVVTLSY